MDETGVIHQLPPIAPWRYDAAYVDHFNQLGIKSKAMSYLRLGYLLAMTGLTRGSRLLDVGYGNGDFLRAAANAGLAAHGYDISGLRLNDARIVTSQDRGVLYQRYRAITFFDSLEHFPELDFVRHLNAEYILISLPWCHWGWWEPGFQAWKHRKPNEHLHHFSDRSLKRFMRRCGYPCLHTCNLEDGLRGTADHATENDATENILTGLFRKEIVL
jgi:SAM-dependent methyltransferase